MFDKNIEIRKVLKIGESLGISIPFKWALLLGLRQGDRVVLTMDGNRIVIKKRIQENLCPKCRSKAEKVVYDNSKNIERTIKHLKKHADESEEYKKALISLLQHKKEKFVFYYCKKCSILYVYSEEGNIYAMETPLEFERLGKKEKEEVYKKFKFFISDCQINYELTQENVNVKFFVFKDRLGKDYEQIISPTLR